MRSIFLAVMLLAGSFASATECPMHQDHQNAGMVARGNKAMGFDQEKTTHHFLMKDDGGIIQVEASVLKDFESRDTIRTHLSHIVNLFSQGNYEIPMFIHDRLPAGVPVMKELKDEITYKYETMERGGRVILSSQNPAAINAIHDFLQFQIEDHKTGDPIKRTP